MKNYSNEIVSTDKLERMHEAQQKEIDAVKKDVKTHCLTLWVLGVFQVITFAIVLWSMKGH